MTSAKSTRRTRPDKPRPDFPLFPHGCGQWAKKIRGRLVYFGPWADAEGALRRYLRQKDDLLAGREPRPADQTEDGVTVAAACNHFLAAKKDRVAIGRLQQRTWDEYYRVSFASRACSVATVAWPTCDRKTSPTCEMTSPRPTGQPGLRKEVIIARGVFKWAFDTELIDRPVRYGPHFSGPSAKTLRINRSCNDRRLFTREQLHTLLDGAGPQMRCMILLGINCGLGNADIGLLRDHHLDLRNGWLDYPRPKTGVERRCHLWPETVAALQEVIQKRPTPKSKNDKGLVFVTKYGKAWHKETADCPVSKEFRKLADTTGVYRRGLTFYSIRHTFATVAGESKDQVAVNAIMGYVDSSIPGCTRACFG